MAQTRRPMRDEQGSGGAVDQRAKQLSADVAVLVSGADLGVPDKKNVADRLNAHDADQSAGVVKARAADGCTAKFESIGLS
jgi:hypothetical protein